MRTFVAVLLPPAVVDAVRGLERPTVDGLRWTAPEQWHITLRFLGEVPDPAPLSEALGRLPAQLRDHDDHDIGIDGAWEAALGPVTAWFAGRRVLHLPVRGLDALAGAVDRALEPVTAPDAGGRPFAAHLTLARVRGSRPGPGRLAGMPVQASWPVEAVSLMGSTLGPGGARYTVLSTTRLVSRV